MKLVLIGKWPPIEGGVSVLNYWTCRILAEAGHEVHVVTNAQEVEPQYRMWLRDEDREMLEPDFARSGGGRVFVHNTQKADRVSYIPWANPYVTKLTGKALSVARSHGCDLIYAHYLEPYGVAAALVSSWLNVPYRIKHAGSDIGRLALIPELGEVYREVLGRAEKVITTPRHREKLEGLGAKSDSFLFDRNFSVPTDYFNPRALPLDIRTISSQAAQWCENLGYPQPVRERIIRVNTASIHLDRPFIGVYGKIGEVKGSFDLLSALIGCHNVSLVAMVNGATPVFLRFLNELESAGLMGRVSILPFLPHWKVPSFIRACRAVCFLERKFPITFHTPTVPREVLACGICLVCSSEVASKFSFANNVADWKNMVVVDPGDHNLLSSALQKLVDNESLARSIGYHGYNLSQVVENFPLYKATRIRLFE
ncbi:MAG: glycosyltransferase [Patescibacteria group bacterium]